MIVALTGGLIASLFFDASFTDVAILAWGAIVTSGIIGFPVVALLSVLFASRGVNPDDVIGPIESSIFDILTVITLTLMIGLII
jgi:cation transporter-like permease